MTLRLAVLYVLKGPKDFKNRLPAAARSKGSSVVPTLRFDRFELDPASRRLLRDGQPVRLGARAFDLLLVLVENTGRSVSKQELLDHAWPGLVVEEANVQVQVSALRKALGPEAIVTIPGRGYRLVLSSSNERAALFDAGKTPDDAAGDLPADMNELIGRDTELEALCRLALEHRLVSVVGPGGIGKTRLALAVARRLLRGGRCRARWLDLAGMTVSADVLDRALDSVSDAWAKRPADVLLLVLDNCEHLADEVGRTLQRMLARWPGIRALVTSQVALRVPGEHVWRLDGLGVPSYGAPAGEAGRCGSVALFRARLAAIDQGLVNSGSDTAAVVELCRRLEGNPLAIEMAAALASRIGVGTVRRNLQQRLRLLRVGGLATPARQRSLRAVLDWSCSLLSEVERRVLFRLSVFTGSIPLEIGQQVAADESVSEWDVLDAMVSLVDRSLLHVEQLDPPRYRLLETTRLYALERLAASQEADAVRRRYLHAMARRWRRGWQEPQLLQCWPMPHESRERSELLRAAFTGFANIGPPRR